MKKVTSSNAENMLQDIYSTLMNFPIVFRDKVNHECAWSTPTFYRKARDPKTLSNAEKEKIVAVLDETFQNLWNHCEKYRKH
jgi:hypothetical protein